MTTPNAADIQIIIDKLGTDHADLIYLFFIKKMSRKELAQQYKVTLKTIDRRISKALTVIRTELDRHP